MIGGKGKIVEIDETCLNKSKYNIGRSLKRKWCVGGIERESKKVFFVTTFLRNKKSLGNIISKYVKKGTTKYTDSWKEYFDLKNMGFNHSTVCHKENFLNSQNKEIHTQNIEIT